MLTLHTHLKGISLSHILNHMHLDHLFTPTIITMHYIHSFILFHNSQVQYHTCPQIPQLHTYSHICPLIHTGLNSSINHYTHPYTNVMLSFHIFLYLTCISFICAFFIYTAYTPRTPTAPHPHLFYLNPLLPFHPPICKLAAKSSFIKEMYVLVYNLYDRSPLKYEKEWMWKLI